ncbi:hypothetical protein GQ43DRAFT_429862 [Delitschia confertaspora ATCC 74209]|uniref:Uncharacterized protein n=1 Tax=Delitschia confertaspora ATCC 74209 TaxID=1513339 RepID=A0A9P4JQT6_9PLEO|nr:hypothetical protein GQ43DRAFT_429862 [Delitschia confertaspora ATCC 74209]
MYSGGIPFMDILLNEVDWIDNLRFDEDYECEYVIVANAWIFQNCTIERRGEQYTALDSSGTERGWIQYYDVEGKEEHGKEKCIVVGRENKVVHDAPVNEKYPILVGRPTRLEAEYKRVGIGEIQTGFVKRWEISARVV